MVGAMLRSDVPAKRLLRRAASRAALLAVGWWVLTDGSPGSWMFGVPTIVGATLVSVALLPGKGWRLSPTGLARFVPFFLWQSLAGGWDVALRALRPGRPLSPDFLDYTLRLPEGTARVFMAGVISLVPGTLTVGLGDDRVRVHLLTDDPGALETLRELESRVADLFGLRLADAEPRPDPEDAP